MVITLNLLNSCEHIFKEFNPPDPSIYNDIDIYIFRDCTHFTAVAYFLVLKLMSKRGPQLTNYLVMATFLQLCM